MRFGLMGASGKQGQRWLDPKNHGTHTIVPIGRNESVPTGLEGVIVATPPETHLAMVQRVPRGMPLLVEKPLGMDLSEVEQILEHSEIVVPCHTYLWSSAFQAWRGALAQIRRQDVDIWITMDGPSPMGNRLLDWGPHREALADSLRLMGHTVSRAGYDSPAPGVSTRRVELRSTPTTTVLPFDFDFGDARTITQSGLKYLLNGFLTDLRTPMRNMLNGFMVGGPHDPRTDPQAAWRVYTNLFAHDHELIRPVTQSSLFSHT